MTTTPAVVTVFSGSQTTTYTYDATDRLKMVDGPSSTVEYKYDADSI